METNDYQRWANPQLILVATNLADRAVLGLQAIAQARRSGARIVLVHIVRPRSIRTALEPKIDSPITSSRVAAAWEVIHRTAYMIESQGILCEPIVVEGDPVDEIPKLVNTFGADRVIVATRSPSGVGRLIEGSVAEALIACLSIPVCAIGPRVVTSPFLDTGGGRVLLVLPVNETWPVYLQFGFELARSRRANVAVLPILETPQLTQATSQDAYAGARAQVSSIITESGFSAMNPEILLGEGDPARAILDQGACPSRDLIVMASSPSCVRSKLLGGSIVHQVLADALCPVITLREPESAERCTSDTNSAVENGCHAETGDLAA